MDPLQPHTPDNQTGRSLEAEGRISSETDLHKFDLLRWEDEGGACPPEDFASASDSAPEINSSQRESGVASENSFGPDLSLERLPETDRSMETNSSPQQGVTPEPARTPATFDEFWPEYLAAHSKPATRLVHYIGPPLGLAYAGACLATGNPLAIVATPLVVYGPLFLSHWLIEGNQPKSFQSAAWSARAEAKMVYLGLTGQLGKELDKYGIVPASNEAPIRKFLRKIGIIKSINPADSE
jgi:hypothetical protein